MRRDIELAAVDPPPGADRQTELLAVRADVSRATLYRLFPGKLVLFRELVAAYSPWEPIARVLDESAPTAPPEEVIPRVARVLAGALTDRCGVLMRKVFEMSRADPDSIEGIQRSMQRGLPDLMRYLSDQMAAGRLREMHPVMAAQLARRSDRHPRNDPPSGCARRIHGHARTRRRAGG
jgi:AcrR family transcriptional regulator